MKIKLDIKKTVIALVGIFLIALGIVAVLSAGKGSDPISVFLQGVNVKTGIKVGTVNQIMNLTFLFIVFLLDRSSIGIASVLYATGIGFFMNRIFEVYPVHTTSSGFCYIETVTGLVLIGVGTAIFLFADYGTGAVEGIMMYINQKSGIPIKFVRMALDAIMVTTGFILGGIVGLGTIIGVLSIGPVIEYTLTGLNKLKKVDTVEA